MEQKIIKLFDALIPYLFWYYDHYLPNNDIDSTGPDFHYGETPEVKRIFNTKIPKYKITVNKTKVNLAYDGFKLEGSPSGYLSLIGSLWGIARGKIYKNTPHIKFLYSIGVMFPNGDLLIKYAVQQFMDQFIDIACALKKQGGECAEEADMILYQVMTKSMRSVVIDLHLKPYEKKLTQYFSPDIFRKYTEFLDVPDTGSTTYQAKIKKLAASPYLTSEKLFHRLLLVEKLHGCIHDTGSNMINVSKIYTAFLHLLDDEHPLIRDIMLETTEVLVINLFLSQSYETSLPFLDILIERGANLDVNLAKRWECLVFLDKKDQSQNDWEALQTIIQPMEPAPAIYGGLHPTYPNYQFWQLFSYIRLAKAHINLSRGVAVSAYKRRKKPKEISVTQKEKYMRIAQKYIERMIIQSAHYIKRMSAMDLGHILPELKHDAQKIMKEMEIGGENGTKYFVDNFETKHVIDYRNECVKHIKIISTGHYKKIAGSTFEFISDSFSIKNPEVNDAMGIEYFVEGYPLGFILDTTINVYHTPATSKDKKLFVNYDSASHIGLNNFFYWVFDKEEDRIPGLWEVEIELDTEQSKDFKSLYSFEVLE